MLNTNGPVVSLLGLDRAVVLGTARVPTEKGITVSSAHS